MSQDYNRSWKTIAAAGLLAACLTLLLSVLLFSKVSEQQDHLDANDQRIKTLSAQRYAQNSNRLDTQGHKVVIVQRRTKRIIEYLQGQAGLPGVPGKTGKVGATGPMGPIGITGSQGEKGDPGEQGAQGPGPTDAQVQAAVDAYCEAHDQCRGPQGEKGEKGDTGETGAQGEPGTSPQMLRCSPDPLDPTVFVCQPV